MSAFGGSAQQTRRRSPSPQASRREFKFTLSKKTVAKGIVNFRVTNKGELSHDFKIAGRKTCSSRPARPHAEGDLEEGGQVRYLCTLPGHAAGGMKGVLTVK